MRTLARMLLATCLLFTGWNSATAQENTAAAMAPPKVLVISREFVKPGKTGMVHEKSESNFVQAMAKAKWPTHYFAVSALSGRSRVLFLSGYDSFDAWEKDNMAMKKYPGLMASLDRASVTDGDLLDDYDQTVATFSEEQSLRPNVDIAHMRYFEISLFQVKPGHRREWNELVKMYIAGYQNSSEVHWATFEVQYGQMDGPVFIVFSALKSGSEIDQEPSSDKAFREAVGADGLKKFAELESSAIASQQTNLFSFTPSMSYVSDEWIKADPDFWKPKMPAPAAAKKPAEKPAN
jgi:hypothetical protein